MSYSKFYEFINNCGVPRTEAEGGELALTRTDALKALELLSDTDVGVLGGDVYELEDDGYFRPTYDNWYCNKDDMSSSEFAKHSHRKALQYLKNYNEGESSNIRYVLVIDDQRLLVASKSRVNKAADAIEDYLGPGAKPKINEAGDLVIESADGAKKVRFDINDPSPHKSPHGHVEEFKKVKNKMKPKYKSGPIYPKDVSHE